MNRSACIPDKLAELINSITPGDEQKTLQAFRGLSNYFCIIPVHRNHTNPRLNKAPVEKGWTRWCYEKRPYADTDFRGRNAGITGGSASRLIIIDIDNHELFSRYLTDNMLDMPETLVVKSGGKSFHHYYMLPYGEFHSRTVREGNVNVFDVIANGRQVLAPGSIHPITGGVYTIRDNLPIGPAPAWLLDLARKSEPDETAKKVAEHVARMASIPSLDQLPQVDVLKLPIPDKQKLNIFYSHPRGTRSEVEMCVINALAAAGVDDLTIQAIFERCPIGEKHRETGQHRFNRLNRQIAISRVFCAEQKRDQSLGLITFGEIEEEDPQMEFIIDSLWPKFEPMMILGKGGVGKSLFALDMLLHMVMPAPSEFLGRFKVQGGHKVLVLQAENSKESVRARQKQFFQSNPMPESARQNLIYVKRSDNILAFGDFLNDEFEYELSSLIEIAKPDILLIDPLISFHGADENSNQSMREVLDKIRCLTLNQKITPLIIHHQGKGEATSSSGGRGASAIGDWNAVSIELKLKSDNLFELIHGKSRDTASFGKVLISRGENLRYNVVDKQFKEKADWKISYVIRALNESGGAVSGQSSLIEKVKSCLVSDGKSASSSNTVRSWIDSACKAGHISEGGHGNLKKYSIT